MGSTVWLLVLVMASGRVSALRVFILLSTSSSAIKESSELSGEAHLSLQLTYLSWYWREILLGGLTPCRSPER